MSSRVLILGAGFGGLELSTMLSEAFGDELEVTLIDKSDAFVFGFSKLDVMFGRTTPDAVRLPYREIAKPGVRFLQETITAIDPDARRVTTDRGSPRGGRARRRARRRLRLRRHARAGRRRKRVLLAGRRGAAGRDRAGVLARAAWSIGVCGAPFKCPPAPSECALLLHDALTARGVRDACEISFVIPLDRPVPPSPDTSAALETEFAKRGIALHPRPPRRPRSMPARGVAVLDDGSELPFDLFLGVPKHRAPDVVMASGMTEDGYVPVELGHAADPLPGRVRGRRRGHGRRAEGGGVRRGRRSRRRAAADRGAAGRRAARPYDGRGSCYIEFGGGRVGRVDIDFLSGPTKTGTFNEPSTALAAEKEHFGSSRRARWFSG